MVAGKKLDISPLPEQRDDYSHYAESEIRWDRIAIAGVTVLLVIILLISLLFSDDDENKPVVSEVLNQSSAEPSDAPHTSNSAVQSTPVLANAADETSQKQATTELADKSSIALSEAKPAKLKEVLAQTSQTAKPELSTLATATRSKPEATALTAPAQPEALRPASVLIVNSSITEAVLSLSLNKDKPGEPLSHSVMMGDELIKVILYTEMKGLKGKVLYHEWYRNGKRQARVKIPVNVSNQNSYSSKFIDKYMLGQWQVKVVDASGEPYVLADFEVTRAP